MVIFIFNFRDTNTCRQLKLTNFFLQDCFSVHYLKHKYKKIETLLVILKSSCTQVSQ